MRFSDCALAIQGDFMKLIPCQDQIPTFSTPSKRPRFDSGVVISPTQPFGVLEPQATARLPFEPEFILAHQLNHDVRTVDSQCKGGIVCL